MQKYTIRLFYMLIFVSMMVMGSTLPSHPNRAQNEAPNRIQRWQEDIDELAAELPHLHKNLFFKLSEKDFKQEIHKLTDELPDLDDEEVIWRLSQIVASVGDAHTALRYKTQIAFPFTLYWFKQGIYTINTVPEYREILNCRLAKVNFLPIEEVIGALKRGISHENLAQIKNSAPYYVTMPEYLYGANLIRAKDSAVFTFENEQGHQLQVNIRAVSLDTKPTWIVSDRDEDDLPLYRQNKDKYYSFTYLNNQKTMYVLYNSCQMIKEQPFKEFVKEVFEHVDSHPVERFIVDLRNNGGGNSAIFSPLLKEIKQREELNQQDKLFVILGRRTFSSAILNALQLKNQTNATFFGEPTGGRPNHYGEIRNIMLKHSHIQVSYSTKYFTHSQLDTDSLHPDFIVEVSILDYLNRKDPVLEQILKY